MQKKYNYINYSLIFIMKKLYIFIGILFFVATSHVSALNIGVSAEAEVGAVGNATSSVKSQNEVKVQSTSSKNQSTSSSTVSASATQIRGWSESDKREFLSTVKAQAQLKSGQDLDNFAKGVMLKDENVTAVDAGDNNVEVRYKLPAKFLGIFSTEISAITKVTFETDKNGRGPKEVTVKFPWYRRFFSLATSTREDLLKTAIDQKVQTEASTSNAYAQNGLTIQLISEVLKAIRAEISASTTAKIK